MKKLLLFALIITLFAGCKKEDNSVTLTVAVNCRNTTLYTFDPIVSGANIYIFKGINVNYPIIGDYDYLGNGIIKNISTGKEIQYSKVNANQNGYYTFEGLSGTYAVVADISNLDKAHKINDWQMTSIVLPQNLPAPFDNTVSFIFNISPHSVSDLGL